MLLLLKTLIYLFVKSKRDKMLYKSAIERVRQIVRFEKTSSRLLRLLKEKSILSLKRSNAWQVSSNFSFVVLILLYGNKDKHIFLPCKLEASLARRDIILS